ncbi:MAG: hypothetical protein ACRDFR_08765, partial [Candidatus Limnocylindria bacterium]
AAVFPVASGFAALLCLTVLSSGGSTFAGTEDSQNALTATTRITGKTRSSVTVAVGIAILVALVPIASALLVPSVIGWVLAVEAVLLSAVLAAEGVREYRLFRAAFNSRNAKLPDSAMQGRP